MAGKAWPGAEDDESPSESVFDELTYGSLEDEDTVHLFASDRMDEQGWVEQLPKLALWMTLSLALTWCSFIALLSALLAADIVKHPALLWIPLIAFVGSKASFLFSLAVLARRLKRSWVVWCCFAIACFPITGVIACARMRRYVEERSGYV